MYARGQKMNRGEGQGPATLVKLLRVQWHGAGLDIPYKIEYQPLHLYIHHEERDTRCGEPLWILKVIFNYI